MLDKSAVEYLHEHLIGHHPVDADSAQSDLLSLPQNSKLESLERFQPNPNRTKAAVSLHSSASFCDYINRFKGKESSIYIDVDRGEFVAVLDHYGAEAPSWCTHTATFKPKKSLEWESWRDIHDETLSQLDFALLIERLLDSIHEPEPNVVLKAALDFQSNEKLALGSTQNLDDGGVRFNFSKDNVQKSVTFPHRIKLWMAVHENEDKDMFDGRVRYRVDGNGVLTFKFSFVKDPRAIEHEAMLRLAEKTRAGTEGLAHYEGSVKRS